MIVSRAGSRFSSTPARSPREARRASSGAARHSQRTHAKGAVRRRPECAAHRRPGALNELRQVDVVGVAVAKLLENPTIVSGRSHTEGTYQAA